jgi:hypothetical protein
MEQLFQKKPLTNRMMMKMKGNNRKFNKLNYDAVIERNKPKSMLFQILLRSSKM